MSQVWTPSSEPAGDSGAADSATLIDGSTFCISDPNGDIHPDRTQGLFVRDARVLSRWALTLDDHVPQLLSVQHAETFNATYVCRLPPQRGRAESTLLLVRARYIGNRLREKVTLHNVGADDAHLTLRIRVEADFADVFEVKDGRAQKPSDVRVGVEADGLRLTRTRGSHELEVLVHADVHPFVTTDGIQWDLVVPGRSTWSTTVDVTPFIDGVALARRHVAGEPLEDVDAVRRLREWRDVIPTLRTADPTFAKVLERSVEDLGGLRLFDDDHPERVAVAAGVPWFMALFGRDSLLTSWMVLPLDSSLAIGTLQTLAEHQGRSVVAFSEEEPGKIMHELRHGPTVDLDLAGSGVYYGTADATALFVMLLGELSRWGEGSEVVDALLPHADRALTWIESYGDADGDGFVEYERKTDIGLANQGWKDSWDGINFADGRIARAPIALAEVQGYTYAAFRARAHLAAQAGDGTQQTAWDERADRLKEQFNRTFWLPNHGWFAVGLDRDKRPIDALTSNIGHCLWTGIVDDDKAAAVADHLMSPEMFSGWGVRTLSSAMKRYNPMSYHNGSIWPHDNALCASGLMRYGFVEESHRIINALIEASEYFAHRLPELFCGFDRADFPEPVPYPTSCSPQAWASAAPVLFLRTLLRLDPSLPEQQVSVAPVVPERYLPLTVEGLRVDGLTLDVDVDVDSWKIRGLDGSGVEVNPAT